MGKLDRDVQDPKDAAAFDKYYFEKHIPIAKKIPGLRKYRVTKGPVMTPGGPSSFHLIATLEFDDMAAIQAAFAARKGRPLLPTSRPSPRVARTC